MPPSAFSSSPLPPVAGSSALLAALRQGMEAQGLDALVVPSEGQCQRWGDPKNSSTRGIDILPFLNAVIRLIMRLFWHSFPFLSLPRPACLRTSQTPTCLSTSLHATGGEST